MSKTQNRGIVVIDGTNTYTWKNGRQLATSTKNGVTWTYTYDANGMRTQRTNGSTTYTYTYDGGKLTQMKMGSSTMRFTYGINGHPVSLNYDGTVYYYITNAQGDVVGILNSSGQEVVSYTYDAWGNMVKKSGSKANDLGTYNPLRYRSYLYDQETGLYYLQSRYYNPEIGRFISADSISYLGADGTPVSYNLFAYCNNNPVNYYDPSGTITIPTLILIGSAVFSALCAGATAYVEYQAEYDVGTIICDSALSGMSAFMLVYSLGMTAYQCYQQFCYVHGKIPKFEVFVPKSAGVKPNSIPIAANQTLQYIDDHNGAAPRGYKGGAPFLNDGRSASAILPVNGQPYYEYDIYPRIKGVERGLERIVIGSDGSVWYTPDHYKTFIRMR